MLNYTYLFCNTRASRSRITERQIPLIGFCLLFFRINLEILKAHFANCVKHSFEYGSEADKDAKISEMVGVLDKLLK